MTNFSRCIYSWTCFIRCKKNFDHILYGTHSRAKWSVGCRFQKLVPRRHFLWNLKCEYLKKERSCGAKTFMANRYYNVCYAESVVFMFHQLLGSIIEIQILLQWRRGASRRHSVFGSLAKDRDLRARETFFRWTLLFLYQFECVLSIFNLKTKFWHFVSSCINFWIMHKNQKRESVSDYS